MSENIGVVLVALLVAIVLYYLLFHTYNIEGLLLKCDYPCNMGPQELATASSKALGLKNFNPLGPNPGVSYSGGYRQFISAQTIMPLKPSIHAA